MSNGNPFSGWIPGVLSKRQVQELHKLGYISGIHDLNSQIDYSSVDLTISNQGYEMLIGSVKPFGSYETLLKKLMPDSLVKPHVFDSDGSGAFTLLAKRTYVFRMQQQLGPEMRKSQGSNFYGQATAKSSVGRMDVLARLIVDGMDRFESFTPESQNRGSGAMFLEITPITFNIRVKPGAALSQLRFFYGNPDISEMSGEELYTSEIIVAEKARIGEINDDECLSVDLSAAKEVGSGDGSAFKVKPLKDRPLEALPLWEIEKNKPELLPDPKPYWDLLPANNIEIKGEQKLYLPIEKESFYILRSKELLALPRGIAVYCRAIDETIGEMRIHYAGFVHPWFGRDREDGKTGTPLIFEVRGHDVQVILTDAEKLAKLTFYRMSEDCEKEGTRPYSQQTLKLSNFFAPWK